MSYFVSSFAETPSSHEAKAGSFFCSVAFKRKAPLGGAGLIKSAPGGGFGDGGGAEGESNISLDKLAANYTLACGQSPSCRHADIPPWVRTAELKSAAHRIC